VKLKVEGKIRDNVTWMGNTRSRTEVVLEKMGRLEEDIPSTKLLGLWRVSW